MEHLQREEPLMDTPSMRERIIAWLGDLPCPGEHDTDWGERLKEFPADPEEKKSDSGVRIRFALRLRTEQNQYLMSILECLAPSARGNYILSVHVNWDEQERKQQRMLEETYQDGFDDTLRARHAIWVQNFKEDELEQALSAGAVAMLGRELIAEPSSLNPRRNIPVDLPYPGPTSFPSDSLD